MAVQTTPYVVTALSHSAELFRRNLQATLPIGSAGGVVPAIPAASANITAGVAGCSDLSVNAPGSGMSVNINPGACYVPGSLGSGSTYGMPNAYGIPTVTLNGGSAPTISSTAAATRVQLTTQGVYYCYNDYSSGQVNLAIAAANASNPRLDVVIAEVQDAAYSGGSNDWALAVVTGTAASSPTVPSLPASCIVLAYVWVPANATNIVSADILDCRIAYNRNPFNVQVYGSAAGTTTSGNNEPYGMYNTIISDISGSWTTTSPNKYTCAVQGNYYMSFTGNVATSAAGQRFLAEISKSGTQIAQGSDGTSYTTGVALGSVVATTLGCKEGDTLQPQYYCSTSGLTINNTIQFSLTVALTSLL
jgi:hypothetical protein